MGFWWVSWHILIPSLLTNQFFPHKFKNPPQSPSQGQSGQFLHTKEKEIARIT